MVWNVAKFTHQCEYQRNINPIYLRVVSSSDSSGCIGGNGETCCGSDERIRPEAKFADHSLVVGYFTDQAYITPGHKRAGHKSIFV